MTGPHALWTQDREGRAPSAVKVARVKARMTLADLAGAVGYSIAHLHRLETTGQGSADLRRRVGAVLGIEIPAPAPSVVESQLVLPGAATS